MKSILICPADRPAFVDLAARTPLATAPILGRSVLEYWIEALVERGATNLLILASDRPSRIRSHVGDGRRWGLAIEVLPTSHELTADEARRRHRHGPDTEWVASDDIVVIDHLPGRADLPLFDSYEGWFHAHQAWMPHAITPGRVGVKQLREGIVVGLRADIDPSARLFAPCWIGDYARIGPNCIIGPGAVIDDRSIVDGEARVAASVVGPDTYVGKHVSVENSIALGALLINWRMKSSVQVPDAFLLADLTRRATAPSPTSLIGRMAALVALVISAPFAIGAILLSLLRGYAPWHLRLGLRSQSPEAHAPHNTFAYYELSSAQNWLRRWPQFWSVFRGDMAWVGNRPLRPTQALSLANDFERQWLAAPVGVISLADAHGCPDGISDEAMAHASYYAVHATWRLDAAILARTLLRAALVWPIRPPRRRDTTVPIQDLIPGREL